MISISNPSSSILFRSALRSISGCDIEHLVVLDLDPVTGFHRPVGLFVRTIEVGDGETRIGSGRQLLAGQLDDLVVADGLVRPELLLSVDDDRNLVNDVLVVRVVMTVL